MLVRKDPKAPRFKPHCHKTWQLSGEENPSQASTTLSDSSSNHQKTYSPGARDMRRNLLFWIFKDYCCCISASTCYEKSQLESKDGVSSDARKFYGSNSQIAVKKYTKIG